MLKPSDPIVVAAIMVSGGSCAIVDLYTRRVPNALTFGISALGLTLAACHASGVSVSGAIGGFALGLALMVPGHVIGATGAGDVKLFAALGALLGPGRTGTAFLYTAIAGGVLALVVAVHRRRLQATFERAATLVLTAGATVADIEHTSADNRFAYAPAIAIGALVAALEL